MPLKIEIRNGSEKLPQHKAKWEGAVLRRSTKSQRKIVPNRETPPGDETNLGKMPFRVVPGANALGEVRGSQLTSTGSTYEPSRTKDECEIKLLRKVQQSVGTAENTEALGGEHSRPSLLLLRARITTG
ncbi:hypothetical protein ZHAS_00022074 [Anopheles sinensis]|uniref:Uncharacterized protein n=1 Tax=Anopheles sinensis TaxID=74873 RepID=A0A084WU05_ANOSI|nr:hypothetical protein ZHAS_00022074 [Anopheles sinensis]